MKKHPYFEIVYLFKGQCTQNIGFDSLCLHSGDLIINAPETLHTLEVNNDADIIFEINLRREGFYEIFAPLLKGSHTVNKFFAEGLNNKSPIKYLLFYTANDTFLSENILRMFAKENSGDEYTEQFLIGYLILGFVHLMRCHLKNFEMSATQFNFSVSRCSRSIKAATGANFNIRCHIKNGTCPENNTLQLMLGLERRQKILEKLKQENRVYVSELSKIFDVTEETIRRDYGGAVLNSYISEDLSFLKRSLINGDLKNLIAKTAQKLIDDDSTIMMDSSTTCLVLLNFLRQRKNLTVITNSIRLAYDFSGVPLNR